MSHEIVGRSTERQRIADLLDDVSAGPVAVVLEGEPGIGKTTVWEEGVAAARARGHHVFVARPVERETQLAFAALGDLLGAVPEALVGELPDPQRRAIDVALLRAEPSGEGSLQRGVAVATLGLLRLLATDAPVLVGIDDVQWLDQPTESALSFVVRRLRDEPIGLLVARRTHGSSALPLGLEQAIPEARVQRVALGGFDRVTLGRLVLSRLGSTLPAPVLTRLHRATAGNPFYALEVGRALRSPERDPGVDLPLPATLHVLVDERLAQLSSTARQMVELAAALSRPTRSVVSAVLGVDEATAAIAECVSVGVLEIDGARLRLSHPLLASVAYDGIPEADRRRMHARLAAAIDDPEERAKHLALSTEQPDEEVASALDGAARRAAARGAPATAADLLEHARRLTPDADSDAWLRRSIEAAERHFDAGFVERACSLLEELVAALPAGARRARVLVRLGWVLAQRDGFHAAEASFRAASEERFDDAALRIEVEQGLAWCLHETVGVPAAIPHAATALELAEAHGDPSILSGALSHVAFLETLEGRGVALATIERALELGHARHWSQILGRPDWVHGLLLQWSGDLATARTRFAVIHADAVARGDEHALPFILFHVARIELLLGHWSAARGHAAEADDTTVDSGQVGERPYSLAIVALVDAHLGLVEDARPRIGEGLGLAESMGVAPARIELLAIRGFLELSCGDVSQADRTFEQARELVERFGLREPSLFRHHGDAIEVKIALGRLDEARELLSELELLAETLDRPILWAIAARCEGLLRAAAGDSKAAYVALERALGHNSTAAQPFEEARTLLMLGSVQRRDRKKRATRESLERALGLFDELGATLWSARAHAELSRVGGRVSTGELTATEAKVAELIAAGLTYREAADALFISPKTVQWNLSKIYRKLGVRSRAELAATLSRGVDAPSSVTRPPVRP